MLATGDDKKFLERTLQATTICQEKNLSWDLIQKYLLVSYYSTIQCGSMDCVYSYL